MSTSDDEKFEVGDKIRLSLIEDGKASDFITTIVHTPNGAGDIWTFRFEDGVVISYNPYSPIFVGMMLKEKGKK